MAQSIRHPFSGLFRTGRIVLSSLIALCALGLTSAAWATTFYVSPSGNDSHDGRAAAFVSGTNGPFRTLQRAAYAVKPGDSVQIRGGVYQATSGWVTDGTASGPITITNYNGEKVIIDGNGHTIPSDKDGLLLQIFGDWYKVSNLEVRYSGGSGVAVHGYHCTVTNVYAHHNWAAGIFITGWYGLIDDCQASNNSLKNEYAVLPISWSFGISACRYPQYTTIRGCRSWNNWGEGISTFEGYHNTIEDCVSYDNMCNFYVSDSKYCLFQRNIAYFTPKNMSQSYCTQNNISAGDEKFNPPSSDNTFINNLSMGGERNFAIGGKCLNNTLIAHNTFVNASNTIEPSEAACVYFFAGTASNARFVNNIVVQDDSESVVMISHLETIGITFSHNCWSRLPIAGSRGTGDVIGNPLLLKTGSTLPGELSPGWFRIQAGSPARDKAIVLSQVTEDFARTPRGSAPEIGAFGISDGISTLTASAAGSPTSGRSPLIVNFTGNAGGGTAPFTYGWVFGDGGTSTSQNPAHTYATAGHYTATLTVTDDSRMSANATVSVSVDATITSLLAAQIGASALSGEAPLAVSFSGIASGGQAPYTFRWSFGDGGTSTDQNCSRSYATAGNYTVTLTVTDRSAATASSSVTVRATAPVVTVLSANGLGSPSTGRAPLFVQFAATAGGGSAPYVYHWGFGDGTSSNRQNPAHTFSSAGTYTVTLTVTDARAARTITRLSVKVLPTEPNGKKKTDQSRRIQPRLILR